MSEGQPDLVRTTSSLSASDPAYVVTGAGILVGLLLLSFLLYMVDVWATERIDGLLLSHYGPELYQRYTSAREPLRRAQEESPTNGQEWTEEDLVIRAYLIAQEQQYRFGTASPPPRSLARSQLQPSRRSDYSGQYSGSGGFSPLPRFSTKVSSVVLKGSVHCLSLVLRSVQWFWRVQSSA